MNRLALSVIFSGVLGAHVHATEVMITIQNFTFNPPSITIKPGTTITWINSDDIPHSVVENNRAFKSPPLDTDQKFSKVFTAVGTTDYFCGFHNHMTGKVIVQP